MGENHPLPVRKAIEREGRRKQAVAAIHALDSKDCVSWQLAAAALNRAGSVNEHGRPWSWSTLKLFVQVQQAVHGISFASTLMLDGMANRSSAGARRRWARTGRTEEVAKAVAASKDLKEAAQMLNDKGALTGFGNAWTAEKVRMFVHNHRADAVSVLESLKPDPELTWDGVAARLNAAGSRTETGLKWTGNNLRPFLRKENHKRPLPLLSWMSGRNEIGSRFRRRRDELAEKVRALCRGKSTFVSAAAALNAAGIKTLHGNEWNADRLMNFDRGCRRSGKGSLLKR
jgi:hypothetical protein